MWPEKRTAGLKTVEQRRKCVSWLGAGGPILRPRTHSHWAQPQPEEGVSPGKGCVPLKACWEPQDGAGPGKGRRARLALAGCSVTSHLEGGVPRPRGDATLGDGAGPVVIEVSSVCCAERHTVTQWGQTH